MAKLKIKPEHIAHIRSTIESKMATLDMPAIIEDYETGNFWRSDVTTNLQLRFNWDLLSAAGLLPFVCSTIHAYANDDHVSTVLKQVCPKITRRY
jgi:hypothetical protein